MNKPSLLAISSRMDMESIATLVLRCCIGIVFLAHGLPKLQHPQRWAAAFVQMGFPGFFAYFAGALETAGGLALVAGLLARGAAGLLAIEMAVAFLFVDARSGPLWQVSDYELSMVLGAASLALAIFGPGSLSLDSLRRNTAARIQS